MSYNPLDWLRGLADWAQTPSYGQGGGFSLLSGSHAPETPLPGPQGIDWGGGFKDFLRDMAPGVGEALAGGAINMMMPGTPSKVMSFDPRTGTGQAAEGLRLGAAQSASSMLQNAFTSPYGALTPEEQYRIRKNTRSADAARGALETGGSGYREGTALETANTNRLRELYGNVGNLTSNYQPMQIQQIQGAENPWARLLTSSLAPAFGKGFGGLAKKFFI